MNPPVVYGIALALASAFLTLALYFLGYHSDAAKLTQAQLIGNVGLLAIGITCTVLGIKGQRAETPAEKEFSYGRALGAGVMVSLVAAVIGIATNWFYFQIINPGFRDLLVQAQLDQMAAKGMNSDQLDKAEKGIRFIMQPMILMLFAFIGSIFWGTIISLVAAAFLKRPAAAVTAATAEPPTLA